MRTCPTCNQSLSVTTFANVHIDACSICGGFWFDNHELAWLTQRAPYRLTELESQYEDIRGFADAANAPRHCPLCRIPLTPHEFAHSPGICMDICTRCHGIWLDHGKLTLIERRLQEFHKAKQQAPISIPSSKSGQAAQPPSPPAAPLEPSPKDPLDRVRQPQQPTQTETAAPPQPAQPRLVGAPPPEAVESPAPAAAAPAKIGLASRRKCPKCAAENPPTAKSCEKCNTLLPTPGGRRWRPGFCPRCHLGMYPARRSGFIVQACSRCEGVWIPNELLRELLEQHFDVLGKFDTNFQLHFHTPEEYMSIHRCPDCVVDLADEKFVVELPGKPPDETLVITHRCPQCNGVWFDAGELHAICKHVKDKEQAGSN